MKEFEHLKPPATEGKIHRIELQTEGDMVGFANLEYRNSPFPFYYIKLVFVLPHARNQGFGKDILNELNHFLDLRKKAGLLFNSIAENDPAYSIYEKAGWKPVIPGSSCYGYNLPTDLENGRLHKAVYAVETAEMEKDRKKT